MGQSSAQRREASLAEVEGRVGASREKGWQIGAELRLWGVRQ